MTQEKNALKHSPARSPSLSETHEVFVVVASCQPQIIKASRWGRGTRWDY